MPDENKQLNSLEQLKGKDNPDTLSISEVTVFKDNPYLAYLYKKTEKLVSALYLLSSFISDKEPIKWQMREMGIGLLSQSLSLSDRSSSERRLAYNNFLSTGLKFISFLEVCYVGEIISEMNYNILRREFESLIKTAEAGEKKSDPKGLVFPNHFFEVPAIAQNTTPVSEGSELLSDKETQINKGQNSLSDRQKNNGQSHTTHEKANGPSAAGRQDIIIDLLKKNTELGIKDFTVSIKGCSEKTIQRELVSLVSKGLIKKEGEKRWSRYSLK